MVAAVAVAVGWFAWSPVVTGVRSGVGAVAGFAGLSGPEIKGRATVAGATTLVVAGTTIRLAGLDAPVADQPCPTGSDRNRRCAAVAQAALSDIVRGQQVACEVVSGGGDSIRTAVCKAGGIDVGGQLVSRGAAFAEQGLFSRYGTEDTAARAAKAGIWRGAAERPSDYKAKLVEAARKQAPNGCAIKGTITGDSKRFVQPWDADYARVRLRTSRGEKWFCSEDEALAAGFKPSART
jgi:endonuclease YncB( thermonuclease family)